MISHEQRTAPETMTSRERMLAALSCKEPDRVPFADWIDPGIRRRLAALLGDAEMDDALFARRIGLDALCFAHDRYMAPVFCEKTVDRAGRVHLGEGLIKTEDDLRRFALPDLHAPGYFDPAERYLDRYGNEGLAIWCGLRTGMMATIFSMGMITFCTALRNRRALIEALLDGYIEWNIELAQILQRLGFDFLVTYDDIAYRSGPFFSPSIFRELFLPRMRRFAGVVDIPWVFHSDGDLGPVFDDLLTLGSDGYNPFEPGAMDIEEYHDRYAGRICFWGNIDIDATLTRGSADDVRAAVRRRIGRLAPGGGYILATSNSVTDHCEPANILTMCEANQDYGRYPIDPTIVAEARVGDRDGGAVHATTGGEVLP